MLGGTYGARFLIYTCYKQVTPLELVNMSLFDPAELFLHVINKTALNLINRPLLAPLELPVYR